MPIEDHLRHAAGSLALLRFADQIHERAEHVLVNGTGTRASFVLAPCLG